jgi:tetrahydromethanopterin S-methyltransferase subunit F
MWQSSTKIIMLVVGLTVWNAGMAQPKTNSPMSSVGLGDILEPDFVAVSGMGRIGAVYHNPYVTNIVNPAALGYLQATSFDIAASGQWARLKKQDFSQDVWTGNLEYLSLSIPLINPINDILERRKSVLSGAINFSITPFSQVGYLVNSSGDIDSLGNVLSNFRGSGGTNRLNLGTGWKYKNIAVGANIGYLFGAMEYQTETVFDDLVNRYDHISRTNYTFRGFLYDLGIMYDLQLKASKNRAKRAITFGAHFNGTTSFTGKEDYLNMVVNQIYNTSDTAAYVLDGKVDGTLPGQFGIGVMYAQDRKFSAGVTFTYSTWGKYTNSARPDKLANTWKVALGGAYTPEYNSITSYMSRVEYRGGLFYQQDPRVFSGTQATEYGASIGFGFPFVQQRFFSFIDFSFEYGWRGVPDGLTENYLRFRVGLNLNDTQWFIKRKFN